VVCRADLESAKAWALSAQPAFIVIADADTPAGHKAFAGLREADATSHIPMILVTRREAPPELGDELCVRRGDLQAAISLCAKAISKSVPARGRASRATLGLLFEPGRDMVAVLHGATSHRTAYAPLDLSGCARCCEGLDWSEGEAAGFETNLRRIGSELQDLVWTPAVRSLRDAAIPGAGERRRSDLQVHIMGAFDVLNTPFEVLYTGEDAPLAAMHPFSRSAVDSPALLSDTSFGELTRSGQKLRAVVAGCPSGPLGAAIGNEVARVSQVLGRTLPGRIEITTILPEKLTRDVLANALAAGADLVHLAGHACPADSGGPDGMLIHNGHTENDDGARIPVRELVGWIRQSGARFFYLSCCFGLDLFARELVAAGLPAFLVFRGRFQGERYLDFATTFYDTFVEKWDLADATLVARAAAHRRGNALWAASVLYVTAGGRQS
jgi:hypothetical protein